MNSIRYFERALFCALLLAGAAAAQNAYVTISAPANNVIAGDKLPLDVSITNLAGTPLDSSGLVWTCSNPAFATVTSQGVVSGLLPGDVTVAVTDPNTQASDSMVVHVVPSAITIQPASLELAAGATAVITAQALDLKGRPIGSVQFQYQSGQPAVADVAADGTVKAIAEGFVTIQARIASATSDAALFATMRVHVMPPPRYKLKKLLSTETTVNTAIAAYSTISAVNSNEVAAIATLANGAQAAVLIENGKPKVLAVTGRMLPNAMRMVIRIDGIAANSKGDVALHIEYPTQWCTASILLIPHGQPEQELATGTNACYANLNPRALAEDGSVLYRYNDQIYKADAKNGAKLLFSVATQPKMTDPIRFVNDFYPSRVGTFILNTGLASGTQQYFYYDGKALTPVYKNGDVIGSLTTTNLGSVVGGTDGKFYATYYTGNYAGLAQLMPGPIKSLYKSTDPVPGGQFGWVQNIVDAGPGGVLLATDLALKTYDTWLSIWNGTNLTPISKLAGWAGLVAGAVLPSGTGIATAQLTDDTALPLRSFSAGSDPVVLSPAAQPFPESVPASIDWHYASRGGTGVAFPVRASGDAVIKTGDAVQTLAAIGSMLPNQKLALWIGGVMANESGDALFTAGFANGSGIFRYRGGVLDTLVDSTQQSTGPSNTSLSWVDSYRGRYLALNNRGDSAAIAAYANAKRVVFFGPGGVRQIAQQNVGGQTGLFNNLNSVAIDDDGHVMFIATAADNVTSAYFWDGNSFQKVLGVGDDGSFGLKINEISNIAGAGHGFVIMTASGNYANRELRTFDGQHLNVVQSTDYTLFNGFGFSYYWQNECTLAANGDAHCMAATQDSGVGVFAHRQAGSDVVVARSRDRFPDGEWMVMPLSVSSAGTGDAYFTAYMYKDGGYFLALYQASQ
jgi:hypothetical protein